MVSNMTWIFFSRLDEAGLVTGTASMAGGSVLNVGALWSFRFLTFRWDVLRPTVQITLTSQYNKHMGKSKSVFLLTNMNHNYHTQHTQRNR